MSDAPPPPPPPPPAGETGASTTAAWYARPLTWVIAAVAVIAVVVVVVLLSGDDDTETEASSTTDVEQTTTTVEESTTTTVEETTTTVEESTTTTVEETTTTVVDVVPVKIDESPLRADLLRADPTDYEMPFEDGEVEAHWYQWDGTYVVVFAGWDATKGDPQCPGSSILNADDEFEFLSSSPTAEGACEPEDRYLDGGVELIAIDDPMGARVCGSLVLFHTIIPVLNDDGTPREGALWASVERIFEGGFVGSNSDVAINGTAVAELLPTAEAYSVPAGWLPDGQTVAIC